MNKILNLCQTTDNLKTRFYLKKGRYSNSDGSTGYSGYSKAQGKGQLDPKYLDGYEITGFYYAETFSTKTKTTFLTFATEPPWSKVIATRLDNNSTSTATKGSRDTTSFKFDVTFFIGGYYDEDSYEVLLEPVV